MANVIRLDLTKLRNSELRGFVNRAHDLIEGTGIAPRVTDAFEKARLDFLAAIDNRAIDSLSLDEADEKADNAWLAFNYQLRASLLHPNAEIAEAAKVVNAAFELTPNPTRLNFDEEYGALETLLVRLEAIPQTTHELAMTNFWLTNLRATYEVFRSTAASFAETASKREQGTVVSARKNVIATWRTFIKRLEILADMDNDDAVKDLISKLNVILSAANLKLATRKSAADRAKDNKDKLPDIDFSAEASDQA